MMRHHKIPTFLKSQIFSGCTGQISRKKNEVVSIGNFFALSPTHCGKESIIIVSDLKLHWEYRKVKLAVSCLRVEVI